MVFNPPQRHLYTFALIDVQYWGFLQSGMLDVSKHRLEGSFVRGTQPITACSAASTLSETMHLKDRLSVKVVVEVRGVRVA
jgi:hypothetical protein